MRNTRILAASLLLLAVAPVALANGLRPLENQHVDAACLDDGTTCGAIVSTMDGCTTLGDVVATGASSDDTTVWRFRYHGDAFFGPHDVNETRTGSAAAFRARYTPGLGLGYDYSAGLYANEELVVSLSNRIRC